MMQKILLLHGALRSSKNFETLVPLLQNNFEVHTLTFEGHGGKTIPNHELKMQHFAEEVAEYLNQNNIDKINIFGYSMGGYVGLYLAKHFSERVEKLYTLATKLNWTVEGATKEAFMLNPIIIKEKVPKFALALEQLHGENWEALLQKTAQMMLQLGKNPTLKNEDFEQITIPVLLSVGDNDAMVTLEETENAFKKMPNAKWYVMPNTIHPIERVNVEELAHHIRKFLTA
jgi:pimeloyl-ACP methyl ester carboxylesterase